MLWSCCPLSVRPLRGEPSSSRLSFWDAELFVESFRLNDGNESNRLLLVGVLLVDGLQLLSEREERCQGQVTSHGLPPHRITKCHVPPGMVHSLEASGCKTGESSLYSLPAARFEPAAEEAALGRIAAVSSLQLGVSWLFTVVCPISLACFHRAQAAVACTTVAVDFLARTRHIATFVTNSALVDALFLGTALPSHVLLHRRREHEQDRLWLHLDQICGTTCATSGRDFEELRRRSERGGASAVERARWSERGGASAVERARWSECGGERCREVAS